MFRRAPQGLKPFLNTLRDGTTEVVPSRTHRSPKVRILIGATEIRFPRCLRVSVAKPDPGPGPVLAPLGDNTWGFETSRASAIIRSTPAGRTDRKGTCTGQTARTAYSTP